MHPFREAVLRVSQPHRQPEAGAYPEGRYHGPARDWRAGEYRPFGGVPAPLRHLPQGAPRILRASEGWPAPHPGPGRAPVRRSPLPGQSGRAPDLRRAPPRAHREAAGSHLLRRLSGRRPRLVRVRGVQAPGWRPRSDDRPPPRLREPHRPRGGAEVPGEAHPHARLHQRDFSSAHARPPRAECHGSILPLSPAHRVQQPRSHLREERAEPAGPPRVARKVPQEYVHLRLSHRLPECVRAVRQLLRHEAEDGPLCRARRARPLLLRHAAQLPGPLHLRPEPPPVESRYPRGAAD